VRLSKEIAMQPTPRTPRRRRDQSFTQRDAARALRAAQAAGVKARVEIDTMRKTITIVPDEPPKEGGTGANPWDEVLTNAANEKRAT
jgi:hypothetical protein